MTDDLVVRLLAAIQERQDRAQREGHYNPDGGGYFACPATRSEPFGDLEWGEDACDCGLAKRRDEVLRMCHAHRKIVETYQGARFTQECHPEYEENNGYVAALAEVLGWLAEGYGIEAKP